MRLSHAIAGIRTLLNEDAAEAVANNRVRTKDAQIVFFIKQYLFQRLSFRAVEFEGHNTPELKSQIAALAPPDGANDPNTGATLMDTTYPEIPIGDSGGWAMIEGVYKMLNLRDEEPTRPDQAAVSQRTVPPGDGSTNV